MLITEDILYPQKRTGIDVLNMIPYLTEAEAVYHPELIPIVENHRIGKQLLALENLQEFCESNGINDLDTGVQRICEAHNICLEDIGFTINDYTLIGNTILQEYAAALKQSGNTVTIKPLSPYDPVSIICDISLSEAYKHDDFNLLTSVLTEEIVLDQDDIDKLKSAAPNLVTNNKINMNAYIDYKKQRFSQRLKSYFPDMTNTELQDAVNTYVKKIKGVIDEYHYHDSNQYSINQLNGMVHSCERDVINMDDDETQNMFADTMEERWTKNNENDLNSTETILKKFNYESQNKPRQWLSKAIAWLHEKLYNFNAKLRANPENASRIKKIIGYITRLLESLTRKLHNMVSAKEYQITQSSNQVQKGNKHFGGSGHISSKPTDQSEEEDDDD